MRFSWGLRSRSRSRVLNLQKNTIAFPTHQEKPAILTMHFSFSPSPPSTSYSTAPMGIPSTSTSRPESPSCAYPSWPRRSSLSSNSSTDTRATSFISDDDLEDLFPSVFEDSEHDCTPPATPCATRSPDVQAQVVADTGALMRELIVQEKAKKEKRQRRRSGSSRKSRSGAKHMSPILEVGE